MSLNQYLSVIVNISGYDFSIFGCFGWCNWENVQKRKRNISQTSFVNQFKTLWTVSNVLRDYIGYYIMTCTKQKKTIISFCQFIKSNLSKKRQIGINHYSMLPSNRCKHVMIIRLNRPTLSFLFT